MASRFREPGSEQDFRPHRLGKSRSRRLPPSHFEQSANKNGCLRGVGGWQVKMIGRPAVRKPVPQRRFVNFQFFVIAFSIPGATSLYVDRAFRKTDPWHETCSLTLFA